jgi:hypothetical protein
MISVAAVSTSSTAYTGRADGLFSTNDQAKLKQAGAWPTAIAAPNAPTIGTATGGNAQATVAFTTPSSLNGETITSYTVTGLPGGVTATGASSPITVSGLTDGTSYTFTVVANTASGASLSSSSSSSITIVAITYSDDVFSTYLYTGNGTSQTIANGIDLAGSGGLVWIKGRSQGSADHILTDTARGNTSALVTNGTNGAIVGWSGISSFNNNGFGVGSYTYFNNSGSTYASWTFRKAAKFFDIVTYTGNGTTQNIAHNLGVAPGMIITKIVSGGSESGVGGWGVYHRSTGASKVLELNSTVAAATDNWYSTAPTNTVFTVNGNDPHSNRNGGTYVAYLFAHDTATNSMIQCGGYTGNSATNFQNLGWEPQYVLIKPSNQARNWLVFDTMRGIATGGNDRLLYPNLSSAEVLSGYGMEVNATGFTVAGNDIEINRSGDTYIYMAIRRPSKPPTSGTQVLYIGTDVPFASIATGFATDMFICDGRADGNPSFIASRLTSGYMYSAYTDGEQAFGGWDRANNTAIQTLWSDPINYCFKRAPGFFDVVCYTGDGNANTSFTHNLGAVPEFIIFKRRDAASYWMVYHKNGGTFNGNSLIAALNTTDNFFAQTSDFAAFPTLTGFNTQIGTFNTSGGKYVAYLFATLAGVSNVGSYTGNGSSQTINCGFTTGARFILIKRANSTGDWYIWDSVRGITAAANDPHLSLNKTSAEVTTDDSIDPANSGFIVKQNATTNINVTSATYIFLAIA